MSLGVDGIRRGRDGAITLTSQRTGVSPGVICSDTNQCIQLGGVAIANSGICRGGDGLWKLHLQDVYGSNGTGICRTHAAFNKDAVFSMSIYSADTIYR